MLAVAENKINGLQCNFTEIWRIEHMRLSGYRLIRGCGNQGDDKVFSVFHLTVNWSFLYLSKCFLCGPRITNTLLNKDHWTLSSGTRVYHWFWNGSLKLFFHPWEKECSFWIYQRMSYGGGWLYHLSLLPSRDQSRKLKLNCNECTWGFIFMTGVRIYSRAFLPSVL